MSVARVLLLTVVTLGFATVPFAQNPAPAAPLDPQRLKSIDSFIAREMARQGIPGLAVGIYSRGQILLAKGYGQANVELGVPVKPETMFNSGSVGKQFVSAAIMMLVEAGKVSLDDSVTKYFPDAPAARPCLQEVFYIRANFNLPLQCFRSQLSRETENECVSGISAPNAFDACVGNPSGSHPSEASGKQNGIGVQYQEALES